MTPVSSSPVPPDDLLAHAGLVRGLAGALVSGDADVDDVVQETWVAALDSQGSHIRSPRSWLASIVRRRAARHHRTRARMEKRHADGARSIEVPTPEDLAARHETIQKVSAALAGLPADYRDVLVLRYYEELPPREVAKRLAIPVETARTRIRRGLVRLRDEFDEQEKRSGGDWRLALLPLLRSPDHALAEAVGAAAMAKTAVLVTLLAVVTGGAVLVWAPWSRHEEKGQPGSRALHAQRPDDRSDADAPSPTLRGAPDEDEAPPQPETNDVALSPEDAGSPDSASTAQRSDDSTDAPAPNDATCVIRIVDDRGEPIEGVRITFYRDPARPVNAPTSVTGKDGTASFKTSGAPEQMHVVKVPPPGRQGGFGMGAWQTHELVIETGVVRSEGKREIVLRRLEPIVGQVLAPDGTPLAGAWVSENAQDSRLPGVRTNTEGRFRFPAPIGTAVDLLVLDAHPRASPPGGRLRGTATEVKPGSEGLIIQLAESSEGRQALVVRVLDPDGRPIYQALVGVLVQDGSSKRKHARTNAEGIAEFDGLPASRITVSVLSDSPAWVAGGQRDLVYEHIPNVVPGDEEFVVRVRKGERLTIRTVTRAGMGLRGVRVRLLRDGEALVLYGGPMPFLETGDGGNCVLLLPSDLDGPLTVEAVYSTDKHTTVTNVSPRQGLVTVELDL